MAKSQLACIPYAVWEFALKVLQTSTIRQDIVMLLYHFHMYMHPYTEYNIVTMTCGLALCPLFYSMWYFKVHG